MSANNLRWVRNDNDPSILGPKITLGLFQSGATQAITAGQLCERTGDSNTAWVPIDSDHDATSTKLCIAGQSIASGDLAGYYEIVEFRDGDVFEFDIDTDAATEPEDAMYYSSPTAMSASGSNILAYTVARAPNAPAKQNRLSEGQLGDNGTTFRSSGKVWVCFRLAVSSYSLIQRA